MADITEKTGNGELVTNRDQLVVVDNIESLIKVGNKEKIGDSIEVLYFEFMPSFNRPVSFYEDE